MIDRMASRPRPGGRAVIGWGMTPRRRRSGTVIPGTMASLLSIAANGWTATWNGAPPAVTPDAGSDAQHYASVFRQGFDAEGQVTTYLDRHVVTARVRNPYPDYAILTPADVALSEYIYATDTIAGVVNNSVETSPQPVGNWAMPARMVVGNTVTLEIVAFHRDGIACVEFIASDGTKTVSQKVSETVVSNRPGDRHAVIVYKVTLDLSTLADNVPVACNAKIYPRIGAAASVLDSSTSANKRGFSPRYFLRNVTLAANPPIAYVAKAADAAKGIGAPTSAGVVSPDLAAAKATPFDTVSSALTGIRLAKSATTGVDGCIIMVGDDAGVAHVLSAAFNTYTQKCGALTITRDPNVPKANARVSWGAAGFRPFLGGLLPGITETALRFENVLLVRTGTSSISGEASAQLQIVFDQCDIDNGNQNWQWIANSHDYHFGTTITNASGSNIVGASTYEHRLFRGVNWQPNTVTGGNGIEAWFIIGSTIRNPLMQRGNRSRTGGIVAFNEFLDTPSTGQMIAIASDEDVTGFALVQNVMEWRGTANNSMVGISHDSATGNDTHIIVWNNTCAGAFLAGRWNAFYDEGNTARTSKLHSFKGNITVQINTKSDVFRGINQAGADASSRTGNWAFMYGVACAGNFSQYIDAARGGLGSSFAQSYPGLACSIGTSDTTATRNDPKFVKDGAVTVGSGGVTYTAGAGGGDYHLQAGSQCKGISMLNRLLTHDLDGNPRPATADTIGAYA